MSQRSTKTQDPTATDIAWVAGFWEGEGYIYVKKHRSKPGGKQYAYLCCGASQNERECLDRLRQWFGGSVHFSSKKLQQIWGWKVTGAGTTDFIAAVWPYLSERRREQIAAKREELSSQP